MIFCLCGPNESLLPSYFKLQEIGKDEQMHPWNEFASVIDTESRKIKNEVRFHS